MFPGLTSRCTRPRLCAVSSVAAKQLAQVEPVDVFHREVQPSVVLAGRQRTNDIRMLEARSELRLPEKALAEPLVAGVEELQGDDAVLLVVARTVDLGHCAAA